MGSPSEFTIYSSAENFYLARQNSGEVLQINRSNSKVTLTDEKSLPFQGGKLCYGVLGIAQFSNKHLVTINEAEFVGRIKDSWILLVKDIEFLSYSAQIDDSVHFNHFRELVKTNSLYFSYDIDLTNSMQNLAHNKPREEFFWNKFLSEEFIRVGAKKTLLPVICGFVHFEKVNLNGKKLDFGIISRRDHRRTGTRFNTRGLDSKGHSVNFVETEQILTFTENTKFIVCSYVQVRGSIPLIWEQKPTLAWEPTPRVLSTSKNNSDAFTAHLQELHQNYGKVYLVNLVDKKKKQLVIGKAFSEIYKIADPKICKYVWFDFHAECKKMKWENLVKLIDQVDESLEKFDWFLGEVEQSQDLQRIQRIKPQKGVFRTNCMDCLDRTNVVQSVLARRILHKQLNYFSLGNSPKNGAFPPFSDSLESWFRNIWADNADALSYFYSGTPAQKTDFTRTGKRTFRGALKDGQYSMQRYVINNFMDGSWQNSLDIFLGRVVPNETKLRGKYYGLFKFLLVLVFVSLANHIIASNSSEGEEYYLFYLLSLSLFLKLIKNYGRQLVDKPLIPN